MDSQTSQTLHIMAKTVLVTPNGLSGSDKRFSKAINGDKIKEEARKGLTLRYDSVQTSLRLSADAHTRC